jgi:hypothetical protein
MEWLMNTTLLEKVRGSNSKLRGMLRRVSEALAGRANFGVEEVREIAEPVANMAPVVAQAAEHRAANPEIRNELDHYAQNLVELNAALERVRCVMLARCASMEAQRGHLATVGLWASAWQQTQPSNQ